jgi:hypothetical protein
MIRIGNVLQTLLCCGLLAAPAAAGEPATPAKVTPELAPDPKVTAALDALGDRSSATLPPIRTVGEWNETTRLYGMEKTGPVGRDYSLKMVWAPERKRALYCAANHGSPHRLNDMWEYDLPSNTWAMLFAPDPSVPPSPRKPGEFEAWVKQVADVKDGVLMTKRGGPLDPWHTWWQVAYVPEMKALIWANPPGCGAAYALPPGSDGAAVKVLGTDVSKLYKGPYFWLFFPEEKKWQPLKTEPPYPPKIGGAQVMEYIPELKGAVFYTSNWFAEGMWLFDPAAKSWKDLKANNGEALSHSKSAPRPEAVMAYDSENKVLVAQIHKATFHYDVATNAWSKVLEEPENSDSVPEGNDHTSPFAYDPVGKVCLLFTEATPGFVWAYSVKDRKWEKIKPTGSPGPTERRAIGYFDPERNVLVINDRTTVWVYRHKRATK